VVERIRYIGKETSRRWEQGEDLSVVDFRCTEYSADKVVADPEVRKKIIEIGIRRITCESRVDRKTVRFIATTAAPAPSLLRGSVLAARKITPLPRKSQTISRFVIAVDTARAAKMILSVLRHRFALHCRFEKR
jgi:hypothetical protein